MSTTKPHHAVDDAREAAEGLSSMHGRIRDAYGDEAAETFLASFRHFADAKGQAEAAERCEQFGQDWLSLLRGEWRAVRARLDEAAG